MRLTDLPSIVLVVCALMSGRINAQTNRVGINTVTPQALLHVHDGSVVFTAPNVALGNPGPPPVSGAGIRMMWYHGKAALRAGMVDGPFWDANQVGVFSVGMGFNAIASGDYAFALGRNLIASGEHSFCTGHGTLAEGNYSFASGNYTKASGNSSVAFGITTIAKAYASTVIGRYNDSTALSSTSWNPEDPLFIIGNGSSPISRSNALTVLKNGNTGIGVLHPDRRLHVASGSSGAPSNSTAIGVFESSTNAAINILTPNGSSSALYFGNPASSVHGGIVYNSSTPFGLAFRTNGNSTKMVITDVGNTGIGTTSPDRKLEIAGNNYQGIRISSINSGPAALEFLRTGGGSDWRIIDSTGMLFIGQSNDDLTSVNEVCRVSGTSFTPAEDSDATLGSSLLRWTQVWAVNGTIQTSDAQDKINIVDAPRGLAAVMQLRPVGFQWQDTGVDNHQSHLGFIAQELQDVIPEAVVTHTWQEGPEGMDPTWQEAGRLGVNYSEIIPVLTRAIQEQQEMIGRQDSLIAELRLRIEALENR